MPLERETQSAVALLVSADGMEARARFATPPPSPESALEAVCEEAERAGVKLPDDEAELLERLRGALAAGTGACDIVVAQGVPPAEPAGERFEWTRDFFGQGFKVDTSTGRINYREHAASESVRAGDVIARVVPGRPGFPGTDVFGRAVAPGEPPGATLAAGRNVTLDAASGGWVAARDGRVRLNGDTLFVDEAYEIDGSVGLETGNILFAGHVLVRQDINDLSVVEAEGGIEVGNVIGAAQVRSGADVVAGRGIAGGRRGKVVAGGVVRAGYIAQAEVRASRGIFVLTEIVQSDVATQGELRVDEGRIVGGRAAALEGIVVSQAGSEAATPTLLAAGEDPDAEAFIAGRESEIEALRKGRAEIQTRVAQLSARRRQWTAGDRERMTEMMFRAQEMESRMEAARSEIRERLALVNRKACRRIVVLGTIHPRVTFRIAGQVLTVDAARQGPVTVTLDASRRVVFT